MPHTEVSGEDIRSSVCELRRISGLSWDELGKVLGASRSTVLSWASGRPLSAPQQVRLRRVLDVIRGGSRGFAGNTRAALVSSARGIRPFDLLAQQRFKEARKKLGPGSPSSYPVLPPLSRREQRPRRPLSPGEVASALSDPVSFGEPGGARAARTVRNAQSGSP